MARTCSVVVVLQLLLSQLLLQISTVKRHTSVNNPILNAVLLPLKLFLGHFVLLLLQQRQRLFQQRMLLLSLQSLLIVVAAAATGPCTDTATHASEQRRIVRPRHPPQLPHPVGGDVSVAVSRLNEPVAGVQGSAAALGHAQALAKVVGEPAYEKKGRQKKEIN